MTSAHLLSFRFIPILILSYEVFVLSIAKGIPSSPRSSLCPVALPQDTPSSTDLLPPSENVRDDGGSFRQDSRIINGDLASENLMPYLVSIQIPKTGAIYSSCTGTLISKRWVITAAHCQAEIGSFVQIGVQRSFSADTPKINVAKWIYHEKYFESNGLHYDVGVIYLEEDAPINSKAMKIMSNISNPVHKSYVRAVGYGASKNNIEDEPDSVRGFLRQVDLPVSSINSCRKAYKKIQEPEQVCAGYKRGKCDTCLGDSGGPIIQYNRRNEPILVGITSFGYMCAQRNFPGVYVRISAFLEWLQNKTVDFKNVSETVQIFDTSQGNEPKNRPINDETRFIIIGAIILSSFILIICMVFCYRYFTKRRNLELSTGSE